MESSAAAPKTLRFGVFEADLSARELRKGGRKIKLQDQPFQVLALLLQRPGEVVGREELQKALWPADTFVEFDRAVNTAIKKIRQALGDSADNPRFIETLPRRGYRFVAPVSGVDPAVPAPAPRRRAYWIPGSIALILLGAAAAWLIGKRDSPEEAYAVPVPLTSYPGTEAEPSFSPDGNHVAFTWDGEKGDNFDIYVKQIGTEKAVRLTTDPARDSHPAWSPDGRHIAFARNLPDGKLAVLVMPAIGGPEWKIAEIRRDWATYRSWAPAWSPDGKWVAFPDQHTDNPADESASIFAVSVETEEKRRLTSAPPGTADFTGAFSPDGRRLVFRRRSNVSAELYLLALSRDLKPQAEPTQITFQNRFAAGPVWTPDGLEIVYYSLGGPSREMWSVPVSGSRRPRRLEFAGDRVGSLAVSRQGNRLAYERRLLGHNIWRLELHGSGGKTGKPTRLIASTWGEGVPRYSPDGQRIAFGSGRSGYNEIWVGRSDGSEPAQLTFLKGKNTGPPRWSPDGKRIFFDSNAVENFEIYVIDADGGRPRRVTNHPADDFLPSFSRDGRWMYFTSARTGRYEIWKMPAQGGEPQQVTRSGAWVGFESPDGKYLYYAPSAGASSLWRVPLGGGSEEKIAEPVIGNSLEMATRGMYFARPPQPDSGNVIEFLSFATGRTTTITTTARPISWFLGVSPDERYLLYAQADQTGSDLMLVEGFR